MAFCDFVVKFNPEVDTAEDVAKRIIYSVWVKRIHHNKPVTIFLGGDSGEGKSMTAVKLQETIGEMVGFDAQAHLAAMNVMTPLEYPQKLEALLHDKALKKVNIITIHEAREVVRAKNWQSFMVQAIADVNQQARQIKPLMTVVVSQFIRDISADMRYTLQFYCIARRPKGKKTRLYINVLWKDDRDLEKPRLRKRKLSGYLKYPDGRMQRFVPTFLEMSLPSKESQEALKRLDREAKVDIVRGKMQRLVDEMKAEANLRTDKVKAMLEFYGKNQEQLSSIGKRYRGSWRMTPEARTMHGIDIAEAKRFEESIVKVIRGKSDEI